jgi:hypothetical protein
VIWADKEGHEGLRVATDGEDSFLAWTHPARLDHVNIGEGPPLRELEPARSLLDIRSPTGELLGHSEIEWPRWTKLSSALALLGDQVATIVGIDEAPGGRVGITLHAKDGTLECKGTLDLDASIWHDATSIEGREQVVVSIERRIGEGEDGYGEYERALLLLGPPPPQ